MLPDETQQAEGLPGALVPPAGLESDGQRLPITGPSVSSLMDQTQIILEDG